MVVDDYPDYGEEPCRKWTYWQAFGVCLYGFYRDKRHHDLLIPFFITFVELIVYPVLLQLGYFLVVGAWLALKTSGQWSGWRISRTSFNRFLFSNLFHLGYAFLFLRHFVHGSDPVTSPAPGGVLEQSTGAVMELLSPMTPRNSPVEWINAISVVVLVGVTGYYAWTTRSILRESEKMRQAAEKQAIAANAQASAAFATLEHLRQQVEDLHGLGKSIVLTTVDSVIRSIDDWKKRDIRGNFAIAESFPEPTDLVPENSPNVLVHARGVSEKCVTLLTSAFDDLRSAKGQIEILRRGAALRRTAYFDPSLFDPEPFLTSAFVKLQDVRNHIS
jgi:hypothetical protein